MARRPRLGSIRNVVTGRSDGYTGRVSFPRLKGATAAFESLISRDFLVVTAAFDTDIASIRSEPTMLVIRIDDEPSRWIPDYEIERADGSLEYVEVKPIEIVEPARARHPIGDAIEVERLQYEANARFEARAVASTLEGRAFRLVTEDEIRIEPRLTNAAMVLRHGDDFYPSEALLAGREALARRRPASIPELQSAVPDLDALVLAIRLQLAGDLDIDRRRPFGRDSGFTIMRRGTPARSANTGSTT